MKVWLLFEYREPVAIYTTREAAEAACAEAIGPNPLRYGDGKIIGGYHVEEWDVEP